MTNTREVWFSGLLADVQRNCHISDALHARNYSLCIYLLKMRELYRWEQGVPFRAPLPKESLGAWLSEREALWERLESSGFTPLRLDAGERPDGDHDRHHAACVVVACHALDLLDQRLAHGELMHAR